jgi:hypothetical protein
MNRLPDRVGCGILTPGGRAMSAVKDRERVRRLVDLLPEDDLPVVERILRGLLDTLEDETPVPDDEIAAMQEALAAVEPGRAISSEEALDEVRAARRAARAYAAWKKDPSRARPYEEFHAELVAEGLLDE